jgi:7-cyano-7-deazaguanine synthase in queuosine biosynthesis
MFMQTRESACSICSQLKERETGFQKYGSDYPDTFLRLLLKNLISSLTSDL